MNDFDRAMMHLDKAFGFVAAPHQYVSKKDEGDKMIVVERGDLVFVFNFHPTKSYTDYGVGCYHPGTPSRTTLLLWVIQLPALGCCL
jgi:1,4-alpha-glucan branching enzyme